MSLDLSSCCSFLSALNAAREVEISAYTLARGATERALIAAAERGAAIRVRLAGTTFGAGSDGVLQRNQAEATKLAAYGIDAAVNGDGDLHLKAAIVDGRAFFDDRNWCDSNDLILTSTNEADVAATRAALAGVSGPSACDGLVFTKGEALREEATLISEASGAICLQTETLSPSAITTCLRLAAKRVPVRILVTRTSELRHPRTRAALNALKALGVRIRVTNDNDKFCLSGAHGWVGSANASGGGPRMSDWGATLEDAGSIQALRTRFDAVWSKAKSL